MVFRKDYVDAPLEREWATLLRTYREMRGLNKNELAARADVPDSTIYRLETGARGIPPSDTVRRIIDGLGLTAVERVAFVTLTLEAVKQRALMPYEPLLTLPARTLVREWRED